MHELDWIINFRSFKKDHSLNLGGLVDHPIGALSIVSAKKVHVNFEALASFNRELKLKNM